MAIRQNTNLSGSLAISPRYQRIMQDPSTGIIIIDDIIDPAVVEAHTEVNRSIAWLKIESGFQVTLLANAPSGLSAVGNHQPWSTLQLLVQTDETYVVEFRAQPLNASTQQRVTGYELTSPGDALYVKIDQTANTVTLYGSAGQLS